jgi:hypothetical protein
MPTSEENVFDDQYLVRYLLGALPADEAERLDELSIANDDFAWRLRGIENDLVDAYVRSELTEETLQQFNAFYLSSAKRRQKVEFAEGLRRFQAGNQTAEQPAGQKSGKRSGWGVFAAPRRALQFAMAAGAFLMLLVAGYLLVDNAHLRRERNDARAQQLSIGQRARDLEKQLSEQRAASAEIQRNLAPGGNSAPDLTRLKTLSLILPPPTRGMAAMKVVTIHPGTDLVILTLTLESADFPSYRVTLKDPLTGKAVFRSPELEPGPLGDQYAVSAGLTAELLKQQNYIAEVVGLSRGNGSHAVGDYPFRVVLR